MNIALMITINFMGKVKEKYSIIIKPLLGYNKCLKEYSTTTYTNLVVVMATSELPVITSLLETLLSDSNCASITGLKKSRISMLLTTLRLKTQREKHETIAK